MNQGCLPPGSGCLLVTHDLDAALPYAHRVVVMRVCYELRPRPQQPGWFDARVLDEEAPGLELADRYLSVGLADTAADQYARHLQLEGKTRGPVVDGDRTRFYRLTEGRQSLEFSDFAGVAKKPAKKPSKKK